jgi:hypothetical protein
MRLVSFLLICVSLVSNPAHAQVVVDHFVGPPIGPGLHDGIGATARFSSPTGIWSDGNELYIADTGNARIRKMALATGEVTTLVGNQPGTLIRPQSLWGGGSFLYVADANVVRRVNRATGDVSLFVDAWRPDIFRIVSLPQPIALAGNSSRLYVLYSPALVSSSLTPVGGPTIREISLATGAARIVPNTPIGAIWADERFLYVMYRSNTGELLLGRSDSATDQFELLFTLPPSTLPLNLTGDNAGHLFFTAADVVYEFDLSTGARTVLGRAPGSATAAQIGGAWTTSSAVYATDAAANTVFKIDIASKQTATIAGRAPTSVGATPPPSSTLGGIRGGWSDGKYAYVADYYGNAIRRIDLDSGQDSVFVGLQKPMAVWGDSTDLYVTQPDDKIVTKITIGTRQISVIASGFAYPTAITGDDQYLYVGDRTIYRVSKANGAMTAVVGDNAALATIAGLWTNGSVIFAISGATIQRIVISSGEMSTFVPINTFTLPTAVTGDGSYLYVSDSTVIRRFSLSTAESAIIAGVPNDGGFIDGPVSTARLGYVQTMWMGGRSLLVVDGRLRRFDLSTQTVSTVAGHSIVLSSGEFPPDQFETRTLTGSGIFLYAMSGQAVYKISLQTRAITHLAGAFNESGTQDGRGAEARFAGQTVLWSDGRFVYVDDYIHLHIRRVDMQTGHVTTFVSGLSAIAAWGDGTYLYVLNSYGGSLDRIDLKTAETTTLVTRLGSSVGIWGDAAYLYLADAFNCVIQKVTRNTGDMRVLAGHFQNCHNPDVPLGPVDGLGAEAFFPSLAAITGDGHLLYVMDGPILRSVDPNTGETHTIAGDYSISGTDDGIGSEAHFLKFPDGRTAIWSDGSNVYVANRAIRRVILTRQLERLNFDTQAEGGAYWKTVANNVATQIGSGHLLTNIRSATPAAAVAVFGHRVNGALVSEAAVPASAPVQSGRIYAEVGGAVNTGIAIANANSQPATVSFYFTDAAGANIGAANMTIAPNSQIAAFLSEAPFRPSGSPETLAEVRSFTFSSSAPVAVIALRGYTNERSEFLMTTLPVARVDVSSAESILLPHFADGAGWRTQVLLVNPTDRAIRGSVEMDSISDYTIAPRSSIKIATPGIADSIRTGVVRITPMSGEPSPVASAVFTFRQGGIVVTESGIPAGAGGRSFRLLAETGSVRTAFAIANAGGAAGNLEFSVLGFDGQRIGTSTPVAIAGRSRLSLFIDEVPGLGSLPRDFRGVLKITATVPVSVIGARGRYNERGDFLLSSMPAVSEDSILPSESVFPHIVRGEEYTTEFVFLSGKSAGAGTVEFFSQSGAAMTLPLQQIR